MLSGFLCGALVAGAVTYFLVKKRTVKAKNEPINFYDPHHLRFVDESYLDKRILPYESAINMRDIGGYTNDNNEQIKWNKIYRGEELRHLSEEDQEKFNNLGIDYILDFRQPEVAARKPDNIPPNTKYINIPVLKGLTGMKLDYNDPNCVNDFMNYIYSYQVEHRADRIAKGLKILRDDKDAVIYVHCTNGKDRTGFFIAVLMLIAGIPEEKILSDYSLTNLTFNKAFEVLGSTMANEVGADQNNLMGFFGVDPDWLKIQLDYIREYGGIEKYLTENTDLTTEDIAVIRKNILERKDK